MKRISQAKLAAILAIAAGLVILAAVLVGDSARGSFRQDVGPSCLVSGCP